MMMMSPGTRTTLKFLSSQIHASLLIRPFPYYLCIYPSRDAFSFHSQPFKSFPLSKSKIFLLIVFFAYLDAWEYYSIVVCSEASSNQQEAHSTYIFGCY